MRANWISRSLRLIACLTYAAAASVIAQGPPPESANYTMVFNAFWSENTHPIDHPANAHFSGLIGGTHNEQVTFWMVGGTASAGIKRMAETGSKSPLDDEVEAAVTDGTAGELISGGNIPSSPDIVDVAFTVTQTHPLVTVVSMIAPSPDWFVGVAGLSLFENSDWVDNKVVLLLPYDAGTDSGTTFTSPNQATIPQVAISVIDTNPFPNSEPLGTFTFWRNPPTSPIFAEGFESGETSVWSASVP